jgi:hypothetical protein
VEQEGRNLPRKTTSCTQNNRIRRHVAANMSVSGIASLIAHHVSTKFANESSYIGSNCG